MTRDTSRSRQRVKSFGPVSSPTLAVFCPKRQVSDTSVDITTASPGPSDAAAGRLGGRVEDERRYIGDRVGAGPEERRFFLS